MGDEQPEWLPVGWKITTRVRSSGKKDKYYVNPSNGLQFSSKPEVLRYLKSSGKDRKPKELDKIAIKRTVAQELPPGWITEIRTRKKRSKKRRDLYYIDPVSGRHFRSMPEVFRYLESKDTEVAKSEPQGKGHDSVELADHSQSSSGDAKRHGSTDEKADKIITDNQSVKSGSEHAIGLKGASRKNVNTQEDNHLEQSEDHSPASELSDKLKRGNRVKRANRMIEIKKLTNRLDKKCANEGQRSKSGSKVTAFEKIGTLILKQRDKEDDSVSGSGTLSNVLPQVNAKEQVNGGRRRSVRLTNSKPKENVTERQSVKSEGGAEKIISTPESDDLKQIEEPNNSAGEGRQHENLARQKKRKTPNSKLTTSVVPRRISKRLAREEIDHPLLEKKTSNKSVLSASVSGEADVTTTKTDIDKAGPSDEPQIDTNVKLINDSVQHSSKSRIENSTNNEEEPRIDHVHQEDKKPDKNLDSSLEDLFMDPCIEFAVKTLTGAIPIEEVKNKVGESPVSSLSSPNQTWASSSSKLPSDHIWADPCFEFAVKMLTGEMPVEDDASRFHISFQQPLGSSLDNVYPPDNPFSQLDAMKKPFVRQQGVKDLSFPHAVNGSSQKQ